MKKTESKKYIYKFKTVKAKMQIDDEGVKIKIGELPFLALGKLRKSKGEFYLYKFSITKSHIEYDFQEKMAAVLKELDGGEQ